MDVFTAYEGSLAAEANGFILNKEILKDVFIDSLKDTGISEPLKRKTTNNKTKRKGILK